MKVARLLFAVVLMLLLFATPSCGQQSFMDEPGIPAFTTSFPVEHGFINLANGNLHIEIPIASYPQRGNISALHARLVYDSRFWTVRTDPVTLAQSWVPNVPHTGISVGGGFRLITDGEPGNADSDRGVATQCACISIINGLCQPRFKITYSNYFYQEPNGTFHRLAHDFKLINKDDSCPGLPSTPDGTAYPIDGSGYKFVITNYTNMTVYAPDGSQVFPVLQDTNGNFYGNSAGQYSTFTNVVDTLGRIPGSQPSPEVRSFWIISASRVATLRMEIGQELPLTLRRQDGRRSSISHPSMNTPVPEVVSRASCSLTAVLISFKSILTARSPA